MENGIERVMILVLTIQCNVLPVDSEIVDAFRKFCREVPVVEVNISGLFSPVHPTEPTVAQQRVPVQVQLQCCLKKYDKKKVAFNVVA